MKLKLIDEDIIQKYIIVYKNNAENIGINSGLRKTYAAKVEMLELIKRELQSPKEEIRKAFEAGQKVEYKDISFDGGDTYESVAIIQDVEEYLKEKGYEKD